MSAGNGGRQSGFLKQCPEGSFGKIEKVGPVPKEPIKFMTIDLREEVIEGFVPIRHLKVNFAAGRQQPLDTQQGGQGVHEMVQSEDGDHQVKLPVKGQLVDVFRIGVDFQMILDKFHKGSVQFGARGVFDLWLNQGKEFAGSAAHIQHPAIWPQQGFDLFKDRLDGLHPILEVFQRGLNLTRHQRISALIFLIIVLLDLFLAPVNILHDQATFTTLNYPAFAFPDLGGNQGKFPFSTDFTNRHRFTFPAVLPQSGGFPAIKLPEYPGGRY